MKYVAKQVMTGSGVEAGAWFAIDLTASLWRQHSSFSEPQPGQLVFVGWRDLDALLAGCTPMGTVVHTVPDISKMQTYETMMGELLTGLLTQEGSPFQGGEVRDVQDPEPEEEPKPA